MQQFDYLLRMNVDHFRVYIYDLFKILSFLGKLQRWILSFGADLGTYAIFFVMFWLLILIFDCGFTGSAKWVMLS